MAIHNKSHSNHALMSLNKMRKDNNWKQKSAADFEKPDRVKLLHSIRGKILKILELANLLARKTIKTLWQQGMQSKEHIKM